MWERENLQIWALIQKLRVAKCRADVKQVKRNRCVSHCRCVNKDGKGGQCTFLQLSPLYNARLYLGSLIKFVIIEMRSEQSLTFTGKTSVQIIKTVLSRSPGTVLQSRVSSPSETCLSFPQFKQCCINLQLYTKHLGFRHVYSRETAPVLAGNSMT